MTKWEIKANFKRILIRLNVLNITFTNKYNVSVMFKLCSFLAIIFEVYRHYIDQTENIRKIFNGEAVNFIINLTLLLKPWRKIIYLAIIAFQKQNKTDISCKKIGKNAILSKSLLLFERKMYGDKWRENTVL